MAIVTVGDGPGHIKHPEDQEGGSMPSDLMIEEIHLCFYVPRRLSEAKVAAVRRVLTGAKFARRVLQTTKAIARQSEALSNVRITVSR
jgi:hypothetical protein